MASTAVLVEDSTSSLSSSVEGFSDDELAAAGEGPVAQTNVDKLFPA
jgi:hypothetical protein